jgi:hypothetical protein
MDEPDDYVLDVREEFELSGIPLYNRAPAVLFGVSPYDAHDNDRIFGYYSYGHQMASMWFVTASANALITAQYRLTLIAADAIYQHYIVHPIPLRESIYDRKLYKPKPIWIDGRIAHRSRCAGWTLYPHTTQWESDSD